MATAKTKAQAVKGTSSDSHLQRTTLSQGTVIKGNNQPKKGMSSDKFSHTYGLKRGGPMKGGQ